MFYKNSQGEMVKLEGEAHNTHLKLNIIKSLFPSVIPPIREATPPRPPKTSWPSLIQQRLQKVIGPTWNGVDKDDEAFQDFVGSGKVDGLRVKKEVQGREEQCVFLSWQNGTVKYKTCTTFYICKGHCCWKNGKPKVRMNLVKDGMRSFQEGKWWHKLLITNLFFKDGFLCAEHGDVIDTYWLVQDIKSPSSVTIIRREGRMTMPFKEYIKSKTLASKQRHVKNYVEDRDVVWKALKEWKFRFASEGHLADLTNCSFAVLCVFQNIGGEQKLNFLHDWTSYGKIQSYRPLIQKLAQHGLELLTERGTEPHPGYAKHKFLPKEIDKKRPHTYMIWWEGEGELKVGLSVSGKLHWQGAGSQLFIKMEQLKGKNPKGLVIYQPQSAKTDPQEKLEEEKKMAADGECLGLMVILIASAMGLKNLQTGLDIRPATVKFEPLMTIGDKFELMKGLFNFITGEELKCAVSSFSVNDFQPFLSEEDEEAE